MNYLSALWRAEKMADNKRTRKHCGYNQAIIGFTYYFILLFFLRPVYAQPSPKHSVPSYKTCVGSALKVPLPRSGGTGMSWVLRPAPGVEVLRSRHIQGRAIAGGYGSDVFEFIFRQPGIYTLTWDLKRPYESEGEGEVFSVTVRVAGSRDYEK